MKNFVFRKSFPVILDAGKGVSSILLRQEKNNSKFPAETETEFPVDKKIAGMG